MLGWDGDLPSPEVRMIEDMRHVLAAASCRQSGPAYYTYRDLARNDSDWNWLHRHNLRFDITAIPPCDVCGECAKTHGHFHPKNLSGTGYPEIFEILDGEAHFLLQTRLPDDVAMVSGSAGDMVIIPPDYGHVVINPSKEKTLVAAHIVSTAFKSDYREYISHRGAAYYEMRSGSLKLNPRYPQVPPVRFLSPGCGRGEHRICRGPLYSLIGNEPALAFLNYPERFLPVFAVLLKG
jgi:glucose-6-phosphate isomerase